MLHCNKTTLFKNLLDVLSRLLSVHAEISPLQSSSSAKEKASILGKNKNKALWESKLIDEEALIIELQPVDGAVFRLVLSSYTRLHIPLNQLEFGFWLLHLHGSCPIPDGSMPRFSFTLCVISQLQQYHFLPVPWDNRHAESWSTTPKVVSLVSGWAATGPQTHMTLKHKVTSTILASQ